MSETCPGCGTEWCAKHGDFRHWGCLVGEGIDQHSGPVLDCPWCQLAQRDERNAALEERIKELKEEHRAYEHYVMLGRDQQHEALVHERDQLRADLATVAPAVRAAMWYATAEAQRNDAEAVMAMGQIYDCVRALPADVRERMGLEEER